MSTAQGADAQSDRELASIAVQRLKEILSQVSEPAVRMAIQQGGSFNALDVPRAALEVLAEGLSYLASGREVRVVSSEGLLSTQEAANALKVSRPFLVKEIELGKLSCTRVGRLRRVTLAEVLRYEETYMKGKGGKLESVDTAGVEGVMNSWKSAPASKTRADR